MAEIPKLHITEEVITNLNATLEDKVSDCLYAERKPKPVSSSQLTTSYVHSSFMSSHT